MAKDWLDRLNTTLQEIEVPAWRTSIFAGYSPAPVKKLVLKTVQNHFSDEEKQSLSELLSLGGRGGVRQVFQSDRDTELRELKRLTLLFHRVMGYHTHEETESLKSTILRMNRTDTENVAQFHVQRGLRMAVDEELWAKEVATRHAGHLVHYYNQGKDKRLEEMDKTENGWCLGMSVQWLGCKATMQEFWGNHGGDAAAGKYRFVMAAQGVRTAGAAPTTDRASFRLKTFNLKQAAAPREKSAPTPQRMAELIARSPSPYCRIGQYYVDGGGHAMAAALVKGGVSFLDPNLGEFFFRSRDGFARWFPLFTRKMDYRFKEFYVEQYQSTQGKGPSPEVTKAITDRRKAMGYDDDD